MKEFPFTIGADPELNILSQGRKVDACYTMRNLLKNDPQFNKEDGLKVATAGYFGWDGCSSTAELRPEPANTAQGLTTNIGKLFSEFVKRISIFDMSTLSFHSSVGGHIHFQLPDMDVSSAKIKNMHKIMSSYYLPLMMSENKINLSLRERCGYGKIKDYHGDNYFGSEDDGTKVRTYEFRVPSAEWITSPQICTAVIAYMGTVWNELLNNPKNIDKDLIYKNEKQGEALQSLLLSEYTTLTKGIFNQIKKSIKTFEYYKEYKDEIDYLFNIEKVINDKKKVNYNIIDGWNLMPENKFTKRDITNKTKFTEKALQKNLDQIGSFFNISYNTDPNCDVFATILGQRAAAFNWKLKKDYFLFGLRKGIQSFIIKDSQDNYLTGTEEIKTVGDLDVTELMFNRMKSRYANSSNRARPITLDFMTGAISKNTDNSIFIGLPYELRMKQSSNEFLKLIYDIEHNELKKKSFTNLLADLPSNTSQQGTIWELVNKPEEEVVMAKENSSFEEAIARTICEQELAEISERTNEASLNSSNKS